MTRSERIPIPFAQRWRLFRYQALPVLTFVAAVALVVYLWRNTTSPTGQFPGQFAVLLTEVNSSTEGTIAQLMVKPFQQVTIGQTIAVVDSILLQEERKVLESQIKVLNESLNDAQDELERELWALDFDVLSEENRLLVEKERRQIERASSLLDLHLAEVELKYRTNYFQFVERLVKDRTLGEAERVVAEYYQQLAKQSLQSNKEVIAEIDSKIELVDSKLKSVRAATAKLPAANQKVFDRHLSPIRAEAKVLEVQIAALSRREELHTIRATANGIVTQIWRWQGAGVRVGDPIVTISQDATDEVVVYMRPDNPARLVEGVVVDVRMRAAAGQPFEGRVHMVGPKMEEMPAQLWRDPTIPEFGMPARITLSELPSEVSAMRPRPGDVIYATVR